MTPDTAIIVAILLPFVAAFLVAMNGDRPNLREGVTISAAIGLFLTVTSLLPSVQAGFQPSLKVIDILPGLAIAFKVEPLGLLFALIASFLWIVTSIYSVGYMRAHHEKNQTRFYAFFAISLGNVMAIAFAGNMITLFIFYEALTLGTYPLVTHAGTPEARRAGRIYLGLLLGTSIGFQLLAIVWTWVVAGTLDFTVGGILKGKIDPTMASVLLVLYVLGTGKAALMPFHRWLPSAMVAPTPVSALLHAVAVVKAGVFTILKISVYIFGLDMLRMLPGSRWITWLAAATIIIASLVAMTRDNLKARLAYSTVSQLSYIVLGAMLANDLSVSGGGLHIATHAFGKITLFFCAGAFMVAAGKTEVSQLAGIGRVMPVTTGAFLVASLSIIGLPPFAGLWSKWYLVLGALKAHQIVMVAVLMFSSVLNVAYLLPIPLRGFFGGRTIDGGGDPVHNPGLGTAPLEPRERIKEAPWPCLFAIIITAAGCVALFLWPEPLYKLLLPIVAN